jgi:hypothetical protein
MRMRPAAIHSGYSADSLPIMHVSPLASVSGFSFFRLRGVCVRVNTNHMSAFGPSSPKFKLYYAVLDKQSGKIVTTGTSPTGILADASEMAGLPKDCFELRPISREEYARLNGRN